MIACVMAPRALAAPEVTVVAVGANHSYKKSLKDLKFAEDDAKRFAQAMTTVGLVPTARSTILAAPGLADVRRVLRELKKGGPDAAQRKFVFYFSGHADDAGIHLKDGPMSRRELHDELSGVVAHTKVAIVDSCFSGGITAKGVEEAAAFELPRMEFDEPSGSVFLSASSGKQFAYESDQLGSSVFTHHLLAGLYGEADGNIDGLVTVDELYQYVYRNTKWQTMSYPARTSQEPEIAASLRGQGAVVLSFPSQTNSKLALEKAVEGDVTIAAAGGLQFFRVTKTAGREKMLQLPAGKYRVSLAQPGRVGDAEVTLEPASITFLSERDVNWRDEDTRATKGADVTAAVAEEPKETGKLLRLGVGGHTGYGDDAVGGFYAEIGVGKVVYQTRWFRHRAEALFNFHRHEQDISSCGDECQFRTDSSAVYATYIPEVRWGAAFIEPLLAVGQTYHDQRYVQDGEVAGSVMGGAIPAYQFGLGIGFGTERRFSFAIRSEMLLSRRVANTDEERISGQMVVLSAVF
jgi:hypothetical protein